MHVRFVSVFATNWNKRIQAHFFIVFPLWFFFCPIFHLFLFVKIQVHQGWSLSWVFTCRACGRGLAVGQHKSAHVHIPEHSYGAILLLKCCVATWVYTFVWLFKDCFWDTSMDLGQHRATCARMKNASYPTTGVKRTEGVLTPVPTAALW